MKQFTVLRKILCLFLVVLLAAAVLGLSGCKDEEKTPTPTTASGQAESISLGTGETVFTLEVMGKDKLAKTFEIHTDEETVGAALLGVGLIAGEQGDYGLYVKTVDGTTLDYDKDSMYWAFYTDGEYAVSGVDTTEIDPSVLYSLRAE